MKEKTLEDRAVELVEKLGGLALKFESRGRRGVPDRFFFLPGGALLVVEFKKSKSAPYQPLQKYYLWLLKGLGFNAFRCDDFDDFKGRVADSTRAGKS